jgi:hypothetical protein
MNRSKLFVGALCLLGTVVATGQTVRNVPSQYATIQAAINVSTSGDQILVAPVIYSGAINYLGKNVVVASTGGAAVTTLTAPAGRVVTFATGETSNAVLQGFTITGAFGGVSIVGASPQIVGCRFMNCLAVGSSSCTGGNLGCNNGGGVYVSSSSAFPTTPTLMDCEFDGCIATGQGGGGLFAINQNPGNFGVALSNCTFSNCAAAANSGFGGAINMSSTFGHGFSATLSGCSFSSCSALSGGAVYAYNSSSTIPSSIALTKCDFHSNSTSPASNGDGSALLAGGAGVSAVGCRFTRNHAGNNYVVSIPVVLPASSATFTGCTIANNTCGAIFGGLGCSGSPSASLVNTIAQANTTLDVYSTSPVATSNCNIGIGTYVASPSNIVGDPQFVDPANGDFHLAPSSPLKDKGTFLASLTPTDLDGGARVVGSAPDIGADEIPALGMPGTGEDFDLFVWKNGGGDPLKTTLSGGTGDVLRLLLRSPGGSFVGATPVLAGILFPSSVTPILIPGLPLYLDGSFFVFAGSLPAGPFGAPGLSPSGLEVFLQAPAGLSGLTFRVQGAVSGGPALNGVFALSSARDVVF